MRVSELPDDAANRGRGIGFQAFGFAGVGCASVVILQIFSGTDGWLYDYFETAVVRLYWAFVVPLAALIDWGRRMFETRREIREAAVARAIQKAVKKAVEKERKRILASLEQYKGLPRKEVEQKIFQVEQS